MKTVYFATGNSGKYKVLKEILEGYEVNLIHENMEFPEELDSPILAEIAIDKVLEAYEKIQKPVIALDAGFYIESLDGFPGHKVNPALKKYKVEGILEMVKGKSRICRFEQCIAYINQEINDVKTFKSIIKGTLSEEPKGSMKSYLWSDLGLVFIPDGEPKTLAEMTEKEWKAWRSKRGCDSVAVKFGMFL